MFKTLTDTSKAAIFTALVLILAVAAAVAINAFGLASNEFAWGAVWSITPVLATVIMLLVVTREGYARKGWQSLGLHRLGLRIWSIAFFGTLLISVAASAVVWATPLASFTAPAGGIINPAVILVSHSGRPTGDHVLPRRRDRDPRLPAPQAAVSGS